MSTENDTNFISYAIGTFLTLIGGIQVWVIRVISGLPKEYVLKEDHKDDILEIKTIIKDGVKSMQDSNATLHERINEIIKK